jgi:GNAT superfamily N-acetyltransferase
MPLDVRIDTEGHWPDELAVLLAGLPEWFGIESSVRAYVEAARALPGAAAVAGDEVVGVCVIRHHTDVAAEIEVLAVRRDLHRHGIGRQLLARVEDDLRGDGIKLLQVKTFGPSGESKEYERTRAFYRACGYLPLEERTDIWAPGNPCLFTVKPL